MARLSQGWRPCCKTTLLSSIHIRPSSKAWLRKRVWSLLPQTEAMDPREQSTRGRRLGGHGQERLQRIAAPGAPPETANLSLTIAFLRIAENGPIVVVT